MTASVMFYVPVLSRGGAERLTVDLLSHLDNGPDCGLDLCLTTDEAESTFLDQLSPAVARRHIDSTAPLPLRLRKLERHVAELGPDVVVSNMAHANVHALLCRPVCRRVGVRLVIVEHTLLSQYLRRRPSLKDRILSGLVRRLYNKADAIVCVSRSVKADLAENFGVDPALCEVIYNAVDPRRIVAKVQEALDETTASFLAGKQALISVGRLDKEKNHVLLLAAFARMCRERKDLVLLVLGEGSEAPRLERYVKQASLGDRVLFLGFQENPYKYIAAADVLVLPSQFESFGLVLIEAMLLGKQVVAVASGGTREVVGDNAYGYLCRNDANDLGRAVGKALDDPLPAERLIARAQEFSGEGAFRAYETLIRNLAR